MLSNLPPFALFFAAALLVALVPGRARYAIMLTYWTGLLGIAWAPGAPAADLAPAAAAQAG